MKNGIVLIFMMNCINLFSQFNFQMGYDLGAIKLPKPLNYDDFDLIVDADFKRENNINFLHRFNFLGEYKLSNNLVTSLTFGFDNYRNRFSNSTSQIIHDGNTLRNRISEYHANVNMIRITDYLGQLVDINHQVLHENHYVKTTLKPGVYKIEVFFKEKVIRKKIIIN